MLVHDNVIPVTVTSKEKPQMAGCKQVKLRTALLSVLTKVLCELSITEAATIHRGEGSNSCGIWNVLVC